MAKDPDVEAGKIAARQFGLITWRQARFRAALSERQIRWRVKTKRWRRVQRGVFAVAGVPGSWEQTLLASQLTARTERILARKKRVDLEEIDDAVVTGRSALWLRGNERLGHPVRHELLVCRGRAPVVSGATVTLTRTLPETDVERVAGVPTPTIPRLAVELCSEIQEPELTAVIDDLLSRVGVEVREAVHARALELRHGRTGVDRLVALTAPGAEERFRSWLERETCRLLMAGGVPPAAWNTVVRDDDGRSIGECDAVWANRMVVVELDGLQFHATDAQRRRDRQKDRRLAGAGWVVLRYTWLDVVERPEELVAEITALLARRPSVIASTDTPCP